VEVGIQAAVFVAIAERKHPELIKAMARAQAMWPVLASGEAGWEKKAARQVEALGLGDDAQTFKVRFRKARGVETHLPARQWAKAAVRTIVRIPMKFAAAQRSEWPAAAVSVARAHKKFPEPGACGIRQIKVMPEGDRLLIYLQRNRRIAAEFTFRFDPSTKALSEVSVEQQPKEPPMTASEDQK